MKVVWRSRKFTKMSKWRVGWEGIGMRLGSEESYEILHVIVSEI